MFGTSGIRRKLKDLPDDFVQDLGKALGSFTESEDVVIGRDTRPSGVHLMEVFSDGVRSTGKNVIDCGLISTPTLGVATADSGCGVMITASHNPPEYNGFKLWDAEGAFRPDQEKQLTELFKNKNFNSSATGTVQKFDYIDQHIDLILSKVGMADGVRVLLDCAGGAGSTITPRLLEEMGCIVTAINTNTDGVFPHPLEPTKENLVETCKIVAEGHFDIGLVHDGDADRTAAIDRDGNLIEWDRFLSVLSFGKSKVATTVDASMRIEEVCDQIIITPVGDVAVADAIRRYDADFGGEPSGTYIFPEIHMYPDGVATAAKVVSMIGMDIFYSVLEEIRSYPMGRLKIPCKDDDKETIMRNLKTVVTEEYLELDGVKILLDIGWILIRPSGTEPYIRVTCEGYTPKDLEQLLELGKKYVKKSFTKTDSERLAQDVLQEKKR